MKNFFNGLKTAFFYEKPQIVYEGDSEFHHIMVIDSNGYRMLCLGEGGSEIETSIYLSDPDKAVFEYPGMMFNSLLITPNAKKILLIGLGGGVMPRIFQNCLPQFNLTVVEIDPIVAELAETYFGFQAKNNVTLVIDDGRDFIENLEDNSYDQIWLDAFGGNYIPRKLVTKEFLNICSNKLTDHGVLVQNLHLSRPITFQNQIKTTKAIFNDYLAFNGRTCGNSIIICQKNSVLNEEWSLNKLLKKAKETNYNPEPYKFYNEVHKYVKLEEDPYAEVLLDN